MPHTIPKKHVVRYVHLKLTLFVKLDISEVTASTAVTHVNL